MFNTPEGKVIHGSDKNSATHAVRAGLPALYPRLWRYAVALTGSRDLADDLAQRGAMRALEQADKFQTGTHLDRWLFTLTRRLWLNELRAQAVRRGNGLIPQEDTPLRADTLEPETNIFASQVFDAITTLPEAQRETVMLVYVEGYSYKEAATLLEIPIGTIMSRLAAARKTLKQTFPQDTRGPSTRGASQ